MPAFAAIGDTLSLPRIASFEAECARVAALKAERQAAIEALCGEINALWDELGAGAARDEYDALITSPNNGCGLGWSASVVAQLTDKCAALQTEKAAREEKIMVIGQQITALWKRLATPESEQTAFLERHAGIGDDVIEACERYLASKMVEFEARLVDLVAQARGTIAGMWDELRLGASQRAEAFRDYAAAPTAFSDDLFLAHEA